MEEGEDKVGTRGEAIQRKSTFLAVVEYNETG